MLSVGRRPIDKTDMPKVDIWERLSPQSRVAVIQGRALDAAFRTQTTDPMAVTRERYRHERMYWNSPQVELARVRDLALDTAWGRLCVRLYAPSDEAKLPVLLYSHGGGYIVGDLDTHDGICRALARRSGWAVLAVDYTLAPERQFPVQHDQVFAVLQHVARQGDDWGLDRGRIVLGGDSAGAHLSLGAALQARAKAGPAVSGLLLYYGGYGLRDSVSSRLYGWSDLDGMDGPDTARYRSYFMPDARDCDHPRYNLLAADLTGLPPAFIGAVAFDPLRDDSIALAELMQERGVAHRLVVYQGVLHAFLHFAPIEPVAVQAIDDGAAFLRSIL
jgi:acetyl esterase